MRAVPATAYGLAGLVAVARVTQRKHFLADVLVGSALVMCFSAPC